MKIDNKKVAFLSNFFIYLLLNSLTSIDSIVKYIENSSIDNIIQEVSKLHNISVDELCNLQIEDYSKEKISTNYYFVLMDIKENIYKYEWLYNRLGDINSKKALLNLLRYRLTADTIFIKYELNENNIQYFDENIIKSNQDGVFVDCSEYGNINVIIESKNYIKNDLPKLAIRLGNRVYYLWKIPELVNSINDNYEFYIRHYEESVKQKTVLYAIPKSKNLNYENKRKGFYLLPFAEDLIRNVILTKDVGLIPYFMHKKIGYDSVLIAGKDENRPYLDKYVSGLTIESINSQLSFDEGIYNYIASNYNRMDVLMLIGIYEIYFDKLKF